jgi:hypothetical protein
MKTTQIIIIAGLLMTGLVACGSEETPAPQKLYSNVEAVPPSASLSVTSLNSYKAPDEGQIIEKSGLFTTNDDVYDTAHSKLLIPRGATISGMYMNDGTNCKILWKSVFARNDSSGSEENAVPLAQETLPTLCNPDKGIKSGSNLNINFTNKHD